MLISAPATIDSRISLIGDLGFPAVLVDAEIPVMFDAGVSIMGPLYVKALKENL